MSTGKIIAIIGGIAIVAGGIWAALPLFVDKEVNEALPGSGASDTSMLAEDGAGQGEDVTANEDMPNAGDDATVDVLAQGSFVGFDALHQAEGTVRIVEIDGKKYVRFENNFQVTNGPDLFVHFGNNGEYAAEANLGKLKGNIGAQNYEIPADIDPDAYNEVWVWCRAFFVPFGKAVLN